MGLLDRFKEAITSVVKKVETKTGLDLPGVYTKAEIRAPAPTPRPTAPAPAPKPTPTPAPAPKKKRSVTTRIKEAAVTAYTKADVAVGGLLPGGVTPQEAGGKVGEIIGQTYVKADIATGGLLPGGVTPQQVAGGVADIAKKVYTKTDVVVGGHLPGAEPTREQSYREGIIQEETQKIEQEKTDIIKETYTPDIQYTMPDTGKVVTGEEYRTMVEQDPYYSEENIRAVAQEAAAQPTYQTDVEGISTTVKEYEPVSDVGYVPQVKTFVSNIGAKVSSSWKGRVTYPAAERISSGIESVERYTGVDLPSTIEEAREHIVESTEFLESKGVSPWISRGGGAISGAGVAIVEDVKEKPLKQAVLIGAGSALTFGLGAATAGAGAIGATVAGARGVTIGTGAVKVGTVAVGTAMGVTLARDVWGQVKAAPTYLEAGGVVGVAAKDVGLIALGGVAGQQLWTKTQGIISTRGRAEIPIKDIVTKDVITGKTTFPEAGRGLSSAQRAKAHKKLFEEGKYTDPFAVKGGGFHAQPEPWYPKASRPVVGEAPLHISGKGVSTRFLRVGGETELINLRAFATGTGKPSVKYIIPKEYKVRVGTEVQRGQYIWRGKGDLETGVAYLPGTKTEVQAILASGTELVPTSSSLFFRLKGVRVPIDEFTVLGGRAVSAVKGTTTAGQISSYSGLPTYSAITPTTFMPLVISSKPSVVSSAPKPSAIGSIPIISSIPKPSVVSIIPKSSVVSKPSTVSSASSFIKPSVVSSAPKPSVTPSLSTIPKPSSIISKPSYKAPLSYKPSAPSSIISKPSYKVPSSRPISRPSYTPSSRPISRPSYSSAGYTPSSSYVPRKRSIVSSYLKSSPIKKRVFKKKKAKELFIPEVKRFGVWKKVGKKTVISKAVVRGKDVVERTLGASFRVRKAGTDEFIKLKETERFRAGKKDPFALVEKAKYRLERRPEVKEIQIAKRKKKIKGEFFR